METNGTIATLATHFVNAILPLGDIVSNIDLFKSYLYRLGWRVDSLPAEFANLSGEIDDLKSKLSAVIDNPDIENESSLLNSIIRFVTAVKSIDVVPAGIDPGDREEFLESFKSIFVDLFLTDYLLQEFPEIYNLGKILGIIDVHIESGSATRVGFQETRLKAGRIPALFKDPLEIPKLAYGWDSADLKFNLMIQHLDELLSSLGITAYIEHDDGRTLRSLDPTIAHFAPFKLVLPIILGYVGNLPIELQLELLKFPARDGNPPGIALLLVFPTELVKSFRFSDDLALDLITQDNEDISLGFVIHSTSLDVISPSDLSPGPFQKDIGISFAYEPGDPTLIVGSSDGSRLEFQRGTFEFKVLNSGTELELLLRYDLQNLLYRLDLQNGDSFVNQITGGKPIEGTLSPELRWSSLHGVSFSANGVVEFNIPSHIDLGLVKLESFVLSVKPDANSLPISISTNLATSLGPLDIRIREIGFRVNFAFRDNYSGNLGPLDIDIGFKPPEGIGLSIDGGGFKGGGFMDYEEENHRYVGMLELEYQDKIAIKAVGLLTTLLPSGSRGFSLLIMITAEFNPIQLGLGFTLNGVGGLMGLNRTANIERLRSGLRDKTLDSILFPTNIIANANRIISDLRQAFPPEPGRFIFGPMAKIGWGTPTLISLDVGLLIELPDPVRVSILGVLKAQLPREDKKLLQLQVNFLGVVDFEARSFAFDASLYASKLLSFTLSGDMAVRVSWGAEPNLLLTAGGFHPAYEPPPLALPTLRRLSLQLLSGDNPRLTLETYFAVTSNTAQFGAKLELYAGSGKFNVYGFLAFDVLFQFNPFYFIADIGAMLALRTGSQRIASISLSLTLEGPTPWHAQGTAKLKICWFLTVKVRFNKTFGQTADNTRLDDVAVLPLLREAFANKGNWEAYAPAGGPMLVSLREMDVDAEAVVVHPFGVIEIRQKHVPLNVEIQKFGSQAPADGNRFAITRVQIAGEGEPETLATENVKEFFAPAQFFERTDAEKLASKSFERYDSGVKLAASEEMNADFVRQRPVDYELSYIDKQRDRRLEPWLPPFVPDFRAFGIWASKGAVADSPLSFANKAKSALAPGAVAMNQESFAVVNSNDLRAANGSTFASSEAEAQSMLNEMIRSKPALAGELQVVPDHEVNRS